MDKIKVGQIVYIHKHEKYDEDYNNNISEFEIYKLEFGLIYLMSTKDNSIQISINENTMSTENSVGTKQTMYLTREALYKEANGYYDKKKHDRICEIITKKMTKLNYEEIKLLAKLFNI